MTETTCLTDRQIKRYCRYRSIYFAKDKHELNRIDYRYDFSEYDPPVDRRELTATQNRDLCWDHPSMPGFQYYFVPDDIYTEERNADPCPFIPRSMNVKSDEYPPIWSQRFKDGRNFEFILNAHKYDFKRMDEWNFICHIIGAILAFGGLCLIGHYSESLVVYLPASFILVIMLVLFPMHRMPPLTFSKRKWRYYKISRFYRAWNKREYKRRYRLALRNIKRYGLNRPKYFWCFLEYMTN